AGKPQRKPGGAGRTAVSSSASSAYTTECSAPAGPLLNRLAVARPSRQPGVARCGVADERSPGSPVSRASSECRNDASSSTSRIREIVGKAASGEEALAAAGRAEPDVAVIDVLMPTMSGIECAHLLQERYPKARVILIS